MVETLPILAGRLSWAGETLTTWLIRACAGEKRFELEQHLCLGPRGGELPRSFLTRGARTRCSPSGHEARAREAKGRHSACHPREGCRAELCLWGRGAWGKGRSRPDSRRGSLPGTKRREARTQAPWGPWSPSSDVFKVQLGRWGRRGGRTGTSTGSRGPDFLPCSGGTFSLVLIPKKERDKVGDADHRPVIE